jgi:dihydrolipoamide dehydrogenase
MASVWSRLGAEVVVIEMMGQIVPQADAQMAQTLERSLKSQGLTFRLKTRVTQAETREDGVALTIENDKGESETLVGDRVLVAVGRKPFTEGLGLEAVGVKLDAKGRVAVNERFETSAIGVYAIGDLIGGPMLAHKAEDEGVAVAEILAGQPGAVNYEAIPSAVYTWPELASVGLTEEQAKERGVAVTVGRYPFKPNGRAKSLGEEEGMAKIIAEAETGQILGVHIVGARASDMIAEAALAVDFEACAEDVARASHAHPTLSEILKEAALAVDGRMIHG